MELCNKFDAVFIKNGVFEDVFINENLFNKKFIKKIKKKFKKGLIYLFYYGII